MQVRKNDIKYKLFILKHNLNFGYNLIIFYNRTLKLCIYVYFIGYSESISNFSIINCYIYMAMNMSRCNDTLSELNIH